MFKKDFSEERERGIKNGSWVDWSAALALVDLTNAGGWAVDRRGEIVSPADLEWEFWA